MLIAVCSLKGSPGVTTLATALTQIAYPVGIRTMVDALARHDAARGVQDAFWHVDGLGVA